MKNNKTNYKSKLALRIRPFWPSLSIFRHGTPVKACAVFLALALLLGGCGGSREAASTKVQEQNQETQEQSQETQEVQQESEKGQAAEDAKEKSKEELSLIMVGDILLHDSVTESGRLPDGTYNYDHMFEKTRNLIQEADLALVNQEVILGGRELGLSGYPAFNGAYEVGDALYSAGFDIVLHATNHALDKGKKGILNCLNYWRSSHSDVAVLGIYDNQEDYERNCFIYEKDGIRVAVLNYTYGTNGISLPSGMPYAVSLLKEEKVKADLVRAEAEADFTIVCPHWGVEYTHAPSAEQKRWAEIMVENGADLIIGTHPHVIQPIEWIEGASGNKALVYYSLGNFINATSGSGAGTTDRMVGGMARVTLGRNENGQVEIQDYGVEPLITHLRYGTQQITTYRLADYTEELASANETRKKDSAFSLEYCKNLCRQVFGALYIE